jgi:hypothetical protein
MIRDVHPGSRILGSKRHRIPDPRSAALNFGSGMAFFGKTYIVILENKCEKLPRIPMNGKKLGKSGVGDPHNRSWNSL